jgi:hypothetical protein
MGSSTCWQAASQQYTVKYYGLKRMKKEQEFVIQQKRNHVCMRD